MKTLHYIQKLHPFPMRNCEPSKEHCVVPAHVCVSWDLQCRQCRHFTRWHSKLSFLDPVSTGTVAPWLMRRLGDQMSVSFSPGPDQDQVQLWLLGADTGFCVMSLGQYKTSRPDPVFISLSSSALKYTFKHEVFGKNHSHKPKAMTSIDQWWLLLVMFK